MYATVRVRLRHRAFDRLHADGEAAMLAAVAGCTQALRLMDDVTVGGMRADERTLESRGEAEGLPAGGFGHRSVDVDAEIGPVTPQTLADRVGIFADCLEQRQFDFEFYAPDRRRFVVLRRGVGPADASPA